MLILLKKIRSVWNQIAFSDLEPSILEAHRDHLLYRTKITAALVVFLFPLTALPTFYLLYQENFPQSVIAISIMIACAMFIYKGVNLSFFKKHYQLPCILLVSLPICGTSYLFPLAGGGKGNFLYPYYLTFFGYAMLLPSRLIWSFIALGIIPFAYLLTEWLIGTPLISSTVVGNFDFLLVTAFLAITGNQIILHLFVTDKRTQFQLQAEKEKLAKVTSQVAHDIRSPLTSLMAALRYWKESGEGNTDYLTLFELAVKRLHSIANEVLDRPDRKKMAVSVFSLHRVLDELVGEYASGNTGIAFRKLYGEAISCFGQRDKIQRAFGNIIKNAIEAMNGRGEITIRTAVADSHGVVEIADNGPGMNAEKLARVLQGGYTEGKKEGHGIGMQVVRETVQEHKGELEAESATGAGTTFRIKLPLPDSAVLRISDQVEEGAGRFELVARPGEQIVVIDDDPSVQLQWELTLREQKLEPMVYESYEDYERKAATRPPLKTAIIDYHYDNSELNGIEIIEKLKEQGFTNLTLCTGEYWKPMIQKIARMMEVPICPKPIPKVVVKAL